MSGGKGSSQTTSVAVPEYIEAAAQRNLNKAEGISQLGYTPYYGPDVAAFSPAQQAAFQNTAGAAGAFGLASPTDPFGGMGAPTDFGGVQGYSSAPLYHQSVDALAANRPGQKQYIDSFFIDPMTGQAGAGVQPAIDYTAYNTAADNQRLAAEAQAREAQAQRDADLAIAQASAPGDTYTSINTPMSYLPGGVNDPFLESGFSQAIAKSNVPDGMVIGDDGVYQREGPSAVQTSLRPQMRPDISMGAGAGGDGGSASGGGYTSFSDMFDGGGPGQSGGAFSGGGAISSIANAATNNNGSGDGGNGGDGCVVATHAVSSGAFTASEKRQAVVWCMSALHGKWWGEAVRRGYRHLGNKKIQQGKAREHYAEFRRYIDFASGKKRTARGGITFALRTAQFFVVGLAKRNA